MQVSNINYLSNRLGQNNPNFGTLNMPLEGEVARIIGIYAGKETARIRPALETLSQDLLVSVQPQIKEGLEGVVVSVQKEKPTGGFNMIPSRFVSVNITGFGADILSMVETLKAIFE